MPQYDYYCPACREQFQMWMSMVEYGQSPKPRCPHCGSAEPHRILSPPGIGSSAGYRRGDGGGCCPGGRCG